MTSNILIEINHLFSKLQFSIYLSSTKRMTVHVILICIQGKKLVSFISCHLKFVQCTQWYNEKNMQWTLTKDETYVIR